MADKKNKNKKAHTSGAIKSTAQVAEVTKSDAEVAPVAKQNSAVSKSADKKAVAAKRVKKHKTSIFVRIGKKIKEVFSELKKVTWPTFSTVVKQTGVVLAVVAIFLVLIFAADSLLAYLFGFIVKKS